MITAMAGERTGAFIATKEHRRFTEFADAVRKHRYIGLCCGPAGVGKTHSARRYARWDLAEPLLVTWGTRKPSDATVYAALAQNRAVFYTPAVCSPFRELHSEIARLTTRVGVCIGEHVHRASANMSTAKRLLSRASPVTLLNSSSSTRSSGSRPPLSSMCATSSTDRYWRDPDRHAGD